MKKLCDFCKNSYATHKIFRGDGEQFLCDTCYDFVKEHGMTELLKRYIEVFIRKDEPWKIFPPDCEFCGATSDVRKVTMLGYVYLCEDCMWKYKYHSQQDFLRAVKINRGLISEEN